MWRWTACLVACLAHDAVLTCHGQDRPVVPLLDQCPGVRFELVMGRITAIHLNTGQFRLHRDPEKFGWEELLQINGEGPVPTVRYECKTATQQTLIDITDSSQVLIEQSSSDGSPQLVVNQPLRGPISVTTWESNGGRRVVTAPTLWHLMLSERRICEHELLPVLQMLRPSWEISEASEQLEQALYERVRDGHTVPRSQLEQLVGELGHHSYQRRHSADRQIRELGAVVLPYLASLQETSLTKEQRHRIRQIQQSMRNAAVDSPERVAQWLVDDEQVWVVLMNHRDPEKRYLAARRLAEIHPAAASFDPYGDERDRQRQLDELRLVLRKQ